MAEPVAGEIGWAISPVISLVINKTTTYIENNFSKKAGIEDDMIKMKTALTEILSDMGTVEKQDFVEHGNAYLVRQIKDAIYDAEDIMDEFEYHLLEEKSQKQQKTVSDVASSCSRAIYQFIGGNQRFRSKVQAVAKSLDQAKAKAQIILPEQRVTIYENLYAHEHEKLCVTSSLICDKIIGREKEYRDLLEFLLIQSDISHQIKTIVGEGGIGKTALVQMVFNDPGLNGHFDSKIWLAVSNKYDMLGLTREILKCVCQNFSTVDVSLDMLQKKLETELPSKKILVVLDDIQASRDRNNLSDEELSEFLALLRKAKQGSKIIVTTQYPSLASLLGVWNSMYMARLSSKNSWSLFQLLAFNDDNKHKYEELVSIGKDIVGHLRGSPLAIKNFGVQLRGNSDTEKWKRILNEADREQFFLTCTCRAWGCMETLYLRYKYLSRNLKCCFAFCGLFPKGSYLKPDQLVHMWIAHGFVLPQKGKSLDEVGRDYFNELLRWAFIQRITQGHKVCYVMYDLMHDLANYVSEPHAFFLIKNFELIGASIRHLSVCPGAIDRLKDFPGLDKLRTLIVLDGKVNPSGNLEQLYKKLKSIRVLDIRCPSLRLTNDIGQCKHLRYLSIPNSDDPLPDSISKLHHLQVLLSI